ncbi:MAG: hypothetical protein GOV01_03940 [Candidatus Altiarchaeota archaeon]|nr:hypothetical protein [Candidatus Altiarchaeota archaeon]
MITDYGKTHPALKLKVPETRGKFGASKKFANTFSYKSTSFPKDQVSNQKTLFVSKISGKNSLTLTNSIIGMELHASGNLHTDFNGTNFLKRIIVIEPGKTLKLTYTSRDTQAYIDDLVYVSENSKLIYDGRFKNKSGEFFNRVHIVHKEPDGLSEVSVKGLVFGHSTVLTTGELLSGSHGSETSVNSFAVIFGNGKVNAIPELLISEPLSNSFHSFKKIHLTSEQMFYLQSRGIKENHIEDFYEKYILGEINGCKK